MKKLLLLGALLATTAAQAQTTYYWPGERASELTDGTQYFIYNTTYDYTAANANDKDRSWFLYSNGSNLRVNNVSPLDFVTTDNSYIFTTVKPDSPKADNHWYLNSVHGIVGIGGQTNNTEIRDIYISKWYGNENILKGNVQSEDENGNLQNPDETDTYVWAITAGSEKNPNSTDNSYAWNGNAMTSAGTGDKWTRWANAHPYAFYAVKSKTLNAEAVPYYNELTARNGKFADIAFLLQKRYGLVQDGSLYYSNYKSTQEGSYEALIDGNDGSYFHSAYGNEAGEASDPKHYLRAEIKNPTTDFYIITKRRCDNNNNRPTSILIEGCDAADGEYSEIKTLEGLPTNANEYFYFSDKISATTAYKYLRFTPQVINTGTRFFTYSEFYIIPATEEITTTINAIKGLYSTRDIKDDALTSESLIPLGTAFDEACENIYLAQAKDDANALISANESNHATDPALGQYPTEAYNALQTAATSETITSEELEEAIKTFKFSINAPVFTINGAGGGTGYSTIGKSIYYNANNANNPLSWNKATNKYDKTMLWKFAGLTSTTPELNTNYSAMNLSENVYLWNIENMQITQTDPANENGQILIKTEGYDNPLHAAAGGSIVRWGTFNENSASAWTLEYVGESKDIEKINEEQLAAYAELTTLIASCEPFKDKIGTGLNQFTSDNLLPALEEAEKVVATDIYEHPELDAITARDALKAAKEALTINQPESGKYYRIKNASNNKYISSTTVPDGRQSLIDDGTDPSTVFYLSADNRLTNSIILNLNMDCRPVATDLGTTYEFLINNNGYYMIKSTERTEPWYPHKDSGNDLLSYDFTGGNYADKLVDAWILEEVTDQTQWPKIQKDITTQYATIAAPVALNIPTGIKAYTAKVNGESATLTEITGGVIPAGVAAVLESSEASSYDFTFAASGSTDNENDLVGVYTATEIPAETAAYILTSGTQGVGFYLLNSEDRELAANKAYLVAPAEATEIKAFTFDLNGGTTGIESTESTVETAEEYYDLQGRRVLNPTKGIYVTKSGKKVLFTK